MTYYVIQAGLIGMAIVFNPMFWLGAVIWPVLFFGAMIALNKEKKATT
jgi:lactate permease